MKQDNNIETLQLEDESLPLQEDNNIPVSFFQPIHEIHEQQKEMIHDYQQSHIQEVSKIPDLSNEVRSLEIQLKKKKFYMSPAIVIVLVLFINLLWFIGIKLFIVPRYENYVMQNAEMKENYESLKSKVDAIVGQE